MRCTARCRGDASHDADAMQNTMQKALTFASSYTLHTPPQRGHDNRMAKNKKYVYLQLYPKDLLADEKLAKCDKASAWGAYLALLNIMSMEEIRGCVRLRDWDSHPNNERKSLVANFRKANSLRTKAAAFARVVAQCTPLKVGPMAEGIEQLLIFGVIVMHDDALIQPRMFRDSHSVLEGYEPEPEPAEETAEDGVDKGAPAPPKKEKNKEGVARTRTLRANTHTRFEDESEYNKGNSIGNKGVQGGDIPVNSKTQGKSLNDENGASEGEKKSGTDNLSSDAQKRAGSPEKGSDGQKIPVADQPPTLREIQDYMQSRGEGGDPFRHITAEQFYDEGCMSGWTIRGGQPLYSWQARLRSLEGYRRKNGEPAVTEEGFVAYCDGKLVGTLAVRQQPQGGQQGRVQTQPKPGDPVGATHTAKDKYKNKW